MSEEILEKKEEVAAEVSEPVAEVVSEQPAAEVKVAEVSEPVAEAAPVKEAKPAKAKPVAKPIVKPEKGIKVVAVESAKTAKETVKTDADGRNNRKTRVGVVVSAKMDKTIVVAVKSRAKHPLYKKTVNKTTKFKAHDEKNECGAGDTVEIAETRHISKDKYFRLARIIEKAK